MSEIIIWTQPDCPHCERIKSFFGAGAYEERDAEALVAGTEPDEAALVQLVMQNLQVPVVRVEGQFVAVHEIIAEIDAEEARAASDAPVDEAAA